MLDLGAGTPRHLPGLCPRCPQPFAQLSIMHRPGISTRQRPSFCVMPRAKTVGAWRLQSGFYYTLLFRLRSRGLIEVDKVGYKLSFSL